MAQKLTLEQFIENAISVHGDKYGYEYANYINIRTNVDIVCKTCGNIFSQTPHSHVNGHGCPTCALGRGGKSVLLDTERFIKSAIEVHGDLYGYDQVDYVHSQVKVSIFCRKCGTYFMQSPHGHKSGDGCPMCSRKKIGAVRRLTKEQFVEQAVSVHGDLYDYSSANYINGRTKVDILCRKCQMIFTQTPHKHAEGRGCPRCSQSKGEKVILSTLVELGLGFNQQFQIAVGDSYYRFDFALLLEKILIEYHGLQHYKPINFFQGKEGLKKTQSRDSIKAQWAKDNDYILIIIPCWIEDIKDYLIQQLAHSATNLITHRNLPPVDVSSMDEFKNEPFYRKFTELGLEHKP